MPDLKPASAVTAIKAKGNDLRRGRSKRARSGWLNTLKVVFLLERPRPQRSSPSVRQIALVSVSTVLGIMVIRVVTRRKSTGTGAEPEAGQAEAGQAETGHAETGQAEAGEAETQAEDREAASTRPTSGNDNVPATQSSLTDTVQTEMSQRGDAPTPAD